MLILRRYTIVVGVIAVAAVVGVVIGWAGSRVGGRNAEAPPQMLSADRHGPEADAEAGRAPAESSREAPKAVVLEPEHNFGSVDLNTEVVHRFKIRNEGTAPLELQLGESTCRCTTGDVPADPIPPGGEAEVTVRFLEERHYGPFQQYAEVLTNDPENRRVTLTIRGIVKSRLAVDPERLDFSGMARGVPATRSMTVYSQMWPQFWLEVEGVTPDGVNCRVTPVSAEGLRHLDALSGYRLDVDVPADLTNAKLEGEVRLRAVTTEESEPQTVVVPFSGAPPTTIEIDSPFLGGGRLLDFGRIPQGKRVEAVLTVRTRDLPGPLALQEAVCDPPHLRVNLQPDPAVTGNYRLSIEVPADAPRFVRLRGQSGRVKVTFNDPAQTSFEFIIWAAVVDPEISLPR